MWLTGLTFNTPQRIVSSPQEPRILCIPYGTPENLSIYRMPASLAQVIILFSPVDFRRISQQGQTAHPKSSGEKVKTNPRPSTINCAR